MCFTILSHETITYVAPWYSGLWRRGVVVITTAQLHSIKPELRFCASSNPACGVAEICDGEGLWQWSWLEIRLNAFRRSTILQKQFIVIIHDVKLTQFLLFHCSGINKTFINKSSTYFIPLKFSMFQTLWL